MTTILDRYLLGREAAALARTLVTLVGLYVLIDLLTQRREGIMNHDVPWNVVVEYYVVMAPQVIYRVAPLAVLVSGLLVLGDAAQANEITAALACGVSLRRLVRMPVLVGLGMSLAVFGLEETVGAPATRRAETIERGYFSRNPEASDRSGISWANLGGEWTCHIMKFNRIALTGENVLIHAVRPDRAEQIVARRIFWDPAERRWLLEDGTRYVFSPGAEVRESAVRITRAPAPFTEPPEDLFSAAEPPETKSAAHLARDIRRAREYNMPDTSLRVDYHAKFSQPALSLIMAGLAIPFALRIRRGGVAISFGAAIGVAITYLILSAVGIWMGDVGRLSPLAAAWFANVLFAAVAALLFARTPT